jgi:hypothetical protein
MSVYQGHPLGVWGDSDRNGGIDVADIHAVLDHTDIFASGDWGFLESEDLEDSGDGDGDDGGEDDGEGSSEDSSDERKRIAYFVGPLMRYTRVHPAIVEDTGEYDYIIMDEDNLWSTHPGAHASHDEIVAFVSAVATCIGIMSMAYPHANPDDVYVNKMGDYTPFMDDVKVAVAYVRK